jgi:hypothetical protein
VEQLGAESGTERAEALAQSALKLVGSHGRRLRRCVSANEGERPRSFGPTRLSPQALWEMLKR